MFNLQTALLEPSIDCPERPRVRLVASSAAVVPTCGAAGRLRGEELQSTRHRLAPGLIDGHGARVQELVGGHDPDKQQVRAGRCRRRRGRGALGGRTRSPSGLGEAR